MTSAPASPQSPCALSFQNFAFINGEFVLAKSEARLLLKCRPF